MSRAATLTTAVALVSAAVLTALGGCAAGTPSMAMAPGVMAPMAPAVQPERPVNGSIYQPGMSERTLFAADNKPRGIGDLVKVEISDKLVVALKANVDSSRETAFEAKGPGSNGGKGALSRLLDMDASASGSNKAKGGGSAGADHRFDGQVVASVINVMPNGNLLLAGERVATLDGNLTTLRFAGLVHPRDIRAGNVVSSNDVAGARLEVISTGDLAESTRRSWLQKVLSNAYSIW
jgi:flagellar L-ring protein FlgH